MEKNKKSFIISGCLFLLFIAFTIIVKYVDVHSIGPEGSLVGLATINNSFRNVLDYNELFYKISEILGYLSLLLVVFYGGIGVKQLIEKKNLYKVDRSLLLLGMFYVLVGIVYIIFEFVIINYRPIILEEGLEASYPSSHTILSICVCISSILISKKIFKNEKAVNVFNIFTIILMVLIVLTRLLSGVHWFSDILGGVIISLFLVSIYYTLINIFKDEKKSQ